MASPAPRGPKVNAQTGFTTGQYPSPKPKGNLMGDNVVAPRRQTVVKAVGVPGKVTTRTLSAPRKAVVNVKMATPKAASKAPPAPPKTPTTGRGDALASNYRPLGSKPKSMNGTRRAL
jgi:hypothetical protein